MRLNKKNHFLKIPASLILLFIFVLPILGGCRQSSLTHSIWAADRLKIQSLMKERRCTSAWLIAWPWAKLDVPEAWLYLRLLFYLGTFPLPDYLGTPPLSEKKTLGYLYEYHKILIFQTILLDREELDETNISYLSSFPRFQPYGAEVVACIRSGEDRRICRDIAISAGVPKFEEFVLQVDRQLSEGKLPRECPKTGIPAFNIH